MRHWPHGQNVCLLQQSKVLVRLAVMFVPKHPLVLTGTQEVACRHSFPHHPCRGRAQLCQCIVCSPGERVQAICRSEWHRLPGGKHSRRRYFETKPWLYLCGWQPRCGCGCMPVKKLQERRCRGQSMVMCAHSLGLHPRLLQRQSCVHLSRLARWSPVRSLLLLVLLLALLLQRRAAAGVIALAGCCCFIAASCCLIWRHFGKQIIDRGRHAVRIPLLARYKKFFRPSPPADMFVHNDSDPNSLLYFDTFSGMTLGAVSCQATASCVLHTAESASCRSNNQPFLRMQAAILPVHVLLPTPRTSTMPW